MLEYHARQGPPILNWYLYSYLVAALAMLAAAWWLREERRIEGSPIQATPGLATAGTILLFLLLNIEIADFFSAGETITFGFLGGSAGLPEDLAYTIGWALFAIGLLAAGIVGEAQARQGLRHRASRRDGDQGVPARHLEARRSLSRRLTRRTCRKPRAGGGRAAEVRLPRECR